ncbi:hypothetical protein H4S02_013359, partial [Coemansia sp. RSA 2611]
PWRTGETLWPRRFARAFWCCRRRQSQRPAWSTAATRLPTCWRRLATMSRRRLRSRTARARRTFWTSSMSSLRPTSKSKSTARRPGPKPTSWSARAWPPTPASWTCRFCPSVELMPAWWLPTTLARGRRGTRCSGSSGWRRCRRPSTSRLCIRWPACWLHR